MNIPHTPFLSTPGATVYLQNAKKRISGPFMVNCLKEWLAEAPASRRVTTDILEHHDSTFSVPDHVEVLYTVFVDDFIIASASYLSAHGIGTSWEKTQAKYPKGVALLDLVTQVAQYVHAPTKVTRIF